MKTSARLIVLTVLAVAAAGTGLCLCLPLGEMAVLAWVAFVPLMVITRGRGFLLSFIAGLAAVMFAAWISSTGIFYATRIGRENDAWLYTGYGIYAVSLSLAFGIWGEKSLENLPAWWFAAGAALFESLLLWKLPAHLALSQYRNAAMVQLASVGGIWLISFLLWWANFSLAKLILSDRPRSEKWRIAAAVGLGIAIVTALGSAWIPAAGTIKRVAAIQVGEPDEKSLTQAHLRATNAGATLVVWPEFSGIPMAPDGNPSALKKVGGAPFVTSYRDNAKPLPHNVASRFADGRETGKYSKRKLFGEETKMHAAGDRAVAVNDLGLNICFDSCFPAVIRETAQLGTNLVALPTIDPPSTHHFVAAIHAAYTPFRCSESGVAMVRADGYAYSMVCDSRGFIVGEIGPGDGQLVSEVLVGPRWTFSKLAGDWFLWACGGLVIFGWFRYRSFPRVPNPEPPV